MGQSNKAKWDLFHWFIVTSRVHPAEDNHLVCMPSLLMTDLLVAQSLILIASFPHAEIKTRGALKEPENTCSTQQWHVEMVKLLTKEGHVQFLRALSATVFLRDHTYVLQFVCCTPAKEATHILFKLYGLQTLICICIPNMFSLNKWLY